MPIEYKNAQAIFQDEVSIDEAEKLFGWLQNTPMAQIILTDCTHLHPINMQVLMAAKAEISIWPRDMQLRSWLESTFSFLEKTPK